MEEQIISFNTAKLAYKIGFRDHSKNPEYIARPTQSLLQKYLREKHNIYILILRANKNDKHVFTYTLQSIGDASWNTYDTYEEALEVALQEAIRFILLNKKLLAIFLIYIIGIVVWIFDVLIPYMSKIFTNIQNHANLNTPLDLNYCFKQILIIFGYTFLLSICLWIISLLLIVKKLNLNEKEIRTISNKKINYIVPLS